MDRGTPPGDGRVIRVGSFEQFGHEAEAGTADVRAPGEDVEHRVHAAAEKRKRRHVGTSRKRHFAKMRAVLQQTDHLDRKREKHRFRGVIQ